jgi:hypothetical protein
MVGLKINRQSFMAGPDGQGFALRLGNLPSSLKNGGLVIIICGT